MPFAIDSCYPRSWGQSSLLVLSSSSGSKSESDSPGPGPWKVWKQLRQLRRLRRSSRTHCHVARLHLPSQELWKDCWRCSNPLCIPTHYVFQPIIGGVHGSFYLHIPKFIPLVPGLFGATLIVWLGKSLQDFAKFLSFRWRPAVELSILVAIRWCFRARPNCFSRVIFDYSKGSRNINASTLLPICRVWDASDCISHQFGDLLTKLYPCGRFIHPRRALILSGIVACFLYLAC